MLTERRHQEILQLLSSNGSVTVQELKEHLGASESTIRRDLNELHDRGTLIKVFGGAVRAENAAVPIREEIGAQKTELHLEEKEQIARFAASFVGENDFVFLDAGTTTGLMIRYLEPSNAVFVTNAVEHARLLTEMGHRVIIIGGELKRKAEAIVGADAYDALLKYHFTKGFFGANGADRTAGYTTPDLNEAKIKSCAMNRCKKSYVLADSSKFGQIASVRFGLFEDAVLLTESIPEAFAECSNVFAPKVLRQA